MSDLLDPHVGQDTHEEAHTPDTDPAPASVPAEVRSLLEYARDASPHAQEIREAYAQGRAAGFQQGRADGFKHGVKKTAAVMREMLPQAINKAAIDDYRSGKLERFVDQIPLPTQSSGVAARVAVAIAVIGYVREALIEALTDVTPEVLRARKIGHGCSLAKIILRAPTPKPGPARVTLRACLK